MKVYRKWTNQQKGSNDDVTKGDRQCLKIGLISAQNCWCHFILTPKYWRLGAYFIF